MLYSKKNKQLLQKNQYAVFNIIDVTTNNDIINVKKLEMKLFDNPSELKIKS